MTAKLHYIYNYIVLGNFKDKHMEDSGNKMKTDFAKKNEKIQHCGCASRLKIAIFVGSFQFSSRFISIDP